MIGGAALLSTAMRRRGPLVATIAFAFGVVPLSRADVIVLANRTGAPMAVQVGSTRGLAQEVSLRPGDASPVFLDGRGNVTFASRGQQKQYELAANCAYYFGRMADGSIDLQQIGLGENESSMRGRSLPGTALRAPSATIPVKILVDEEEPARRHIWEQRLRRRVEAASKILDAHARIRLKVVAVETWNSDNSISDFFESLAEFEREVDPRPARLAIGFTSQFQVLKGRVHMAGTRGPLRPHILLREFSPKINEAERLEFLVHELGHHLGASHSPEGTSVMRPVLGDNLAGRADFPIRFDPVNTLIMSLVGEEMRRRNVDAFQDMTNESRYRLRQIYDHLAKTMPDDPAGGHFLSLTRGAIDPSRTPVKNEQRLPQGIRHVLTRLSQAARENAALPEATEAASTDSTDSTAPKTESAPLAGFVLNLNSSGATLGNSSATRRSGDALFEYYVRTAAEAARELPGEIAPKAMLLALGVAMDDGGALKLLPEAVPILGTIETPGERSSRTEDFGTPTIHGRADLAKHFVVSACLTSLIGAEGAKTAGITKETLDSQRSSGFSFVDLAANQAGIVFGEHLIEGKFSMLMVAGSFRVPMVMPSVDGLPEGLTDEQVRAQFGTPTDRRFLQQLHVIELRVQNLPTYRPATFKLP